MMALLELRLNFFWIYKNIEELDYVPKVNEPFQPRKYIPTWKGYFCIDFDYLHYL